MMRAQRLEGLGVDDAGGLQLGEGPVAVLAGLVAGVVAAAQPLDQRDRLGDLAVVGRVGPPDRLQTRALVRGPACSKA